MKKLIWLICLCWITTSQAVAQTWETNSSTVEEFDFLRARAGLITGTPLYRHLGDAGKTYSPGDWDRIVANKNVWVNNPAADRYTNYYKGCETCQFPRADLANNSNPYDTDDGYFIKDAAFFAHLTNDASLKTAVRNEIMNNVVNATYSYNGQTIKAFDFYNTKRWVPNTFQDINPGFGIADWVTRTLFAFQWSSARGTAWSDADKAAFNNWVKGAGYFLKTNYDIDADALFKGRSIGNYTPTSYSDSKEADPTNWANAYIDASGTKHYARYIAKFYSNRRHSMAGAVGQIGVHLRDAGLISSAKNYFKETIRFAIYPNGVYCDFHRLTSTQPQKGFSYTHSGMMHAFMFADALARIGDRELIDYETTAGTTGTDGSSDGVTKKGLQMHILAMCKLWKHQSPALYGTDDPALATGSSKANYLIDGSDALHGDKAVWYVYFAALNVYYKNSTIRDVYLQDAVGVEGYPQYPQTIGARNAYTGANYPGFLFMFGQREASGPNPYPGSISLTPQTITFSPISDKTYGDGSFSLTATAPGGGVTFSTPDPTKVSINGSTVTIKGTGPVVIYANQGGSSSYAAAPQTSQSFVINKKPLTFSVTSVSRVFNKPNPVFSGTYSAFAYGETASVLTTQPTISTTATQSSDVGIYAISASNGSALNYALSYVPGSLTITKGTVTLAVGANLNRLTTDAPFNLNVVAYEQGTTNVVSGLPLGYAKQSGTSVSSVSSTGLITLSGTTGTSTILLTVSTNTNYFQVTNTFVDVVVSAAPLSSQNIVFNALAKTYGDAPFTLTATGGGSGNPVTFISSDPTIATCTGTNGATVTILKAGIVNIKANQAGNGSYQDAPEVIRQLTINPKSLQVTADNKTRVYGTANPTFTFSYSGFVSGENSTNLTSLPIGSTAAGVTSNVGSYLIVPSGASSSNGNYAFTYVNGSLSVTQASQSITFPTISDKGNTEVPFQLNATASSGLAVSYSLVSGPATVSSSGLVTLNGSAGSVTVRAAQTGNINFSAASTVDQTFAVLASDIQQSQLITVAPIGVQLYSPGGTFTINATANSGLLVTTTVVSGPATIAGNVVTKTGAGSIVLKSVQAGNSSYFPAADVFTTVTVNKANQVISSPVIADKYINASTFTVSAVASSGGFVTMTANNKLTQNTANSFTPLALGQAVITVSQAGDANYNPATLYLTFNVVAAPTTGSSDVLAGKTYYKGAWKSGTGTSSYYTYRLSWPLIGSGGEYTATRFVLRSGVDSAGNVLTGNILKNFNVQRWTGTAFTTMLNITNNSKSTFDTTLANVSVVDQLYITSTGQDLTKSPILRTDNIHLYAAPASTPAPGPGNNFSFTLGSSASTSAGVYRSSDGVLLRTLWSGVTYAAGTYNRTWDRIDDDGNTISDTVTCTVKVLSNNVTYAWEGVMGNTSYGVASKYDIHRGLDVMNGMAVSGSYAYFCMGYSEGNTSTYKFSLSTPQSRIKILPTSYPGPPDVEHVATDGTTVYWACLDPYASTQTFVYGTKVSNDAYQTFSSGSVGDLQLGVDVPSAINIVNSANSRITGLAVQQAGSYLFVSRKGLNNLYVLNKTTGALAQTISISNVNRLAVDSGDKLWVQAGTTLTQYTVNGGGTITATGVTVTGLTSPQALTSSGSLIVVADGGASQQVKAFSTTDGSGSWTLGTSGGYASDATVTNSKFYFSDNRGTRPVFLAFQPDGSFWVGDGGNSRVQKYNSSRTYLDRILFLPVLYNSSVCLNDNTRIFAGNCLEFSIDYGQPLSTGWALTKNWGYVLTSGDWDNLTSLQSPVTMTNGRTYVMTTKNGSKDPFKIWELVSGGVARYTGKDAGSYARFYADGSYRFMSYSGSGQQWKKYTLTGFDGSNNPLHSGPTTYVSTADRAINNNGTFLRPGEVSSSNIVVAFDGGKTVGYHLGGVNLTSGAWMWKTSKSNSTTYSGPYPYDGTYEIGNRMSDPNSGGAGSAAMALENSIIWGYYGEFWKGGGGQVNKYNHYYDNGLFIGQFGVARDPAASNDDPIAGMAGNGFTPFVVKFGSDYYLYHNDESFYSGVHRWKISGLNSIQIQTCALTE